MTRTRLYLDGYDWDVVVYYDVDEDNADGVMLALQRFGVSAEADRESYALLTSGDPNTGLTISDLDRRKSIMVIGRTTSAAEFADTYSHEKGHLATHIAQADGIDPFGEDYQYLAGAIGRQTFPTASRYLCDCCRRRK